MSEQNNHDTTNNSRRNPAAADGLSMQTAYFAGGCFWGLERYFQNVDGVTDTTDTMAAKAHLRNGGPLVLAVATNDGLAGAAPNLGALLGRKNVYFVPFGQDDCQGKPASLVADFSRVPDAVDAALRGEQLQPVLLGAKGV